MPVPTLSFSTMTDDDVRSTLKKYSIGLTIEEARKIEQLLKRPPTVVEAVIWGIQGSEHSSYKSSRRFLKNFPTSGKHVILGPKEDSGIVALTDGPAGKRWGIVISHESHNHPSQVVPFEGAATGVGGTVRDVACMGARVIGAMDMLRLGDLKTPGSRGIAKEVMRGIGGYGNPLGVPNLGGDTVFDSGFNSNCLVNAIGIGIVREDEVIHSEVPDEAAKEKYDIILIGKPTDRSGFGGAAFSSLSIDADKHEQNTGAVQEPNPFLERHLLVSSYALFDWLVANKVLHRVSFKDLGAGGVMCASVEQVAGKGFGAAIDLDKVHTSIKDLPPEVIACAETQERFCWMCHPSLTQQIVDHYNVTWDLPSVAEGARASVIGTVNDSGMYTVTHKGETVCNAKALDITAGIQYVRPTEKKNVAPPAPSVSSKDASVSVELPGGKKLQTTITELFREMLKNPNHGSKSRVYRHFDKSVIGNTVIDAGEADASVIMPLQDLQSYLPGGTHPGWTLQKGEEKVGAVFAADGNPRHGRLSAYWQGVYAAMESICNVVAVGGTPRALTDCLNYGNPEIPVQLGFLEEGVQGIADASRALFFDDATVPVVSGNVSLYNSLPDGSSIPPSAIVCCVGVIADARKAVTMQCKKRGSRLLLLGDRSADLGASALHETLERMTGTGALGGTIPVPNFEKMRGVLQTVLQAIGAGKVLASHDISDGGLLLALFEMLCPQRKINPGFGMSVDLSPLGVTLPPHALLFSEIPGFVLEVAEKDAESVKAMAVKNACPVWDIGTVTDSGQLEVRNGPELFSGSMESLLSLWERALPDALQESID